MRFIDFLKNKALNEMAVERRIAISVSDSQFNSVINSSTKGIYWTGSKISSSGRGVEKTDKRLFKRDFKSKNQEYE